MKNYKYTFLTETGRRQTNQDNAFIFINKKHNAYLLVLADGMGGYKGGETASKIVIDTAGEVFNKMLKKFKNKESLKYLIQLIFDTAQINIREHIVKHPELSGMGTTMVCVLIVNNMAVWGNIGDSRAYLKIAEEDPAQITKDHSLVQDYVDKHGGKVPASYLNQYSNVITRSLAGTNDKIEIFPSNTDYFELGSNFTFLLCSDGLILDKSYDYSYFFFETINKSTSIEEAANELYHWAYNSGSTDNVTVVILTGQKKGNAKNNKKKSFTLLFLFLMLLLIGSTAYFIYKAENKSTILTSKTKTKGKIKVEIPKKEPIPWDGFAKTQPIEYSGNNKKFSFNWMELKGHNNVKYQLNVLKEKSNQIMFDTTTTSDHITSNEIKTKLDKLIKGSYIVKLFAITDNDTLPSPKSIKLKIK